ncbi:MAG: ATP-binding protein [Parabacteroides gordonii]|uniref:ATP-binding protein n=1 Tax=Parabacteroides gordonii TaxID=574930 RepID=UPI003A86F74C
MNTELQKLPIGIQSFEDLRSKGYAYVDKTALIYEMVTRGKPYFLSRPRRFGKSLLISTLEAYFQGKKELFRGLAIEQLEKDWFEYPVLHLDLNAEKYENPESLIYLLSNHLTRWEEEYGQGKDEPSLSTRFAGIIRRAYEKTGKQVAVLIDEYDKPLLQALGNDVLLETFQSTLKAFYGVLKSADPYLQFVLLTGVTKFAHVSVFSDLNQLNDISMARQYATLCGLTKGELTANFTNEIASLGDANDLTFEETIDTLTKKYDGYHFHPVAEGVFNPFSVLNVLVKQDFSNYWFQTGTPTFLIQLLKKSNYDLRRIIEGVELRASAFSEYRVEANNPIPVIYQSGYLTIKDYDREFQNYTLAFPNEEVEYGFLNFIVPFYTPVSDDESGFYIEQFIRELRAGETDAFLTRLKAFFADFPYELNDRTERHYQVVFYLVFKLMGQFCDAEVRSARGRADAVVKTKDYIYVFEFKLDGSAEDAIRQIDEKGYLIPYIADGRTLIKVSASFSAEERNIAEWITKD